MSTKKHRLTHVHARLFEEDLGRLKQLAAQKLIPWQTELRLLVHRALAVRIVSDKENT